MICQTLFTQYLYLEYTNIKNDNHISYVGHWGHLYLCLRYTNMKNNDHRSCVEHQGHSMYVWYEQILTSIIIDDASKHNKRISLFHAHFFLPCSIFCACLLLVSLSFYFIVAVLMLKCWGQHSYMSSTFL